MNSNTYRFSTRDDERYITKNGELLENPSGGLFDWGWYGFETEATAYFILHAEYGYHTASQYFHRFAREYLAEMDCNDFTWTSGAIAVMIKQLEDTDA